MICIDDLRYRYPDGTEALKGITLTVPDGEFLLVCGPNGSGKTTLIRHLNGLLKPSSGSVEVDGFGTVDSPRDVLQRVGMVFQDADSQIVGETVREDVAFGPENMGLSAAEVENRVEEALETVGMTAMAEKPCHLLSGGEKRRVAIAGVLAMRSRILVFDELFVNLDYRGVQQVLRQVVQLHREGHTILLTTHDVEKVIAHVDRIVIVYKGELKASGAPDAVISMLEGYQVRPPCTSLPPQRALSWLPD